LPSYHTAGGKSRCSPWSGSKAAGAARGDFLCHKYSPASGLPRCVGPKAQGRLPH
jgi:hypothetical protein